MGMPQRVGFTPECVPCCHKASQVPPLVLAALMSFSIHLKSYLVAIQGYHLVLKYVFDPVLGEESQPWGSDMPRGPQLVTCV